jgi:hypothetical protein
VIVTDSSQLSEAETPDVKSGTKASQFASAMPSRHLRKRDDRVGVVGDGEGGFTCREVTSVVRCRQGDRVTPVVTVVPTAGSCVIVTDSSQLSEAVAPPVKSGTSLRSSHPPMQTDQQRSC